MTGDKAEGYTGKESTGENDNTFKKCDGCPFECCTNICPIQISLAKRNVNKMGHW